MDWPIALLREANKTVVIKLNAAPRSSGVISIPITVTGLSSYSFSKLAITASIASTAPDASSIFSAITYSLNAFLLMAWPSVFSVTF